MGQCKTANKGDTNLQKGAFSFPTLQDGEEGDTVCDAIDDIAAIEEVL